MPDSHKKVAAFVSASMWWEDAGAACFDGSASAGAWLSVPAAVFSVCSEGSKALFVPKGGMSVRMFSLSCGLAGAFSIEKGEKAAVKETGQSRRNSTAAHRQYEKIRGAFFRQSRSSRTARITALAVRLIVSIRISSCSAMFFLLIFVDHFFQLLDLLLA